MALAGCPAGGAPSTGKDHIEQMSENNAVGNAPRGAASEARLASVHANSSLPSPAEVARPNSETNSTGRQGDAGSSNAQNGAHEESPLDHHIQLADEPAGRASTPRAAAESGAVVGTPQPTQRTGRSLLVVVVAIALLLSLVLLRGPSRPTSTAVTGVATPRPTATHTPAPTPTPAGTPIPTPLPGYAVYVDPDFLIQYPANWDKQKDVEFSDTNNDATARYVVTVYRPPDPSNCPATDTSAAATCWVNLYFSGLQQQEAVQNFARLTGPTPTATIGGQVWQSGVATFGPTTASNRFQVYATVYEGQPFVIALLAPDDVFSTGNQLYFKPMLATFQFLSPPAP